jgi:Zn-dependent protease with chaperone function
MPFARRWLPAFCAAILLAGLASLTLAAQPAATPAAPAPAAAASAAPASPQQAYSLPPDKLAKAIALSRIRNIMDIVGSLWGLAILWLLLASRAAARLESWVQSIVRHRWLQGLVFFAAFLLITALASLPLDGFSHHVSRAYGISVQGWGSWFGDEGKAFGLTLLLGAPLLLLFSSIVRRWPRRYWLGAWIATLPLLVLVIFVLPLLQPIFDTFEPLTKNHSALVTELERVVTRTGTNIPPDRMFLMKASLKTNGLNAYVSGLGATKRIVVWDTTAGRIPDDEVLFIFGHESGHYVLNHIPKMIAEIGRAHV